MNLKSIKKARELGYRTEADYPDYSSDSLSPCKMLVDYEDSCCLEEMIDRLDDREKQIIKHRFYADRPMTLNEIAQMYGRSIERIRDIINDAVFKIGKMWVLENGETGGFVREMEEKPEQDRVRRKTRSLRNKYC